MDFQKAKDYIVNRMKEELPENYYYHCLEHTLDVLDAVEIYAAMEHVDGDDLVLLKTAALYHDSGFLIQYSNNEVASVQLLCDALPGCGYSLKQIEVISEMILSTEIPQKPKNLLSKILCDADLDYLGRDDFYMIGIRLYREWVDQGIISSLKDWYQQEVYFLEQHEYFTKSAVKLRQEKKRKHLDQVKELLGGDD